MAELVPRLRSLLYCGVVSRRIVLGHVLPNALVLPIGLIRKVDSTVA